MKNLFTSASLKLTAWYLLVLMIISLLFSLILYSISVAELKRSLRDPGPNRTYFELFLDSDAAKSLRESRYNESKEHLIGNLVVLNIGTLVAGGGISYILARRTLKPIESAVEAQGRFTSDASHELRTPLAIMKSEIEIGLRNKTATKDGYRQLLQSNLEEVDRLHELSDRLLQLSGERELPLESVSLEDVAIDAVNRAIKPAQKHHVSIKNEVGTLMVRANKDALTDVLVILLDNAIKYGGDDTTVVVSATRSNKMAQLSVADQGLGIEPEHVPYLFERFYRVDESRSKHNVEGHGLGLSIAKRIVEQHHGRISVASKRGQGTTFEVQLPLV